MKQYPEANFIIIEDCCHLKKNALTYQRKVCRFQIFTWLLVNLPCHSQSIKTGQNPKRVHLSHHRTEHAASLEGLGI